MEQKHLKGAPLFLAMLALSIGTFLIVLDYTIANIAIPYIAGDLAVSADQGVYVITSFAVGSAISLAITGWLTERIGIYRLSLLSLLGFIVLSWACGMSRSMALLVVSRFLQGFAAGPLVPVTQSLTIAIFPPDKKEKALSFWSTVVVVAPVIGPILGGWISYNIHWSWIFFINIPIGLFALLIIAKLLKPFETPRKKTPTDWVGLILLTIGVSTLQFLLDKGEQYDWLNSTIIRTCAVSSIVSFSFLIAWEYLQKNPILDLRLLKIRSFALSVLFIGTMYAVYFGSVVLVPLWLQENMGYTPTWAGIAVAPIGIPPLLMTWAIGAMAKRYGNLLPIAISLLLFSASCFITARFNTNVDIWHVGLTRMYFGFGILFFIVPLFSLTVRDVSQEKLPKATSMFHFVRAMMGGVGASVFTTLWIRRSAFHHANQVATILPSRQQVTDFYAHLKNLHFSSGQSQALVNELATNQGSVLGLNDCFYAMGWIFIGMLAILILGKRKRFQTA